MLLPKNARWRKFIIPLALSVGIHFSYVPAAQAGDCSWWDAATLGISCVVKLAVNRLGESEGKGFVRGIKPEFNQMVNQAAGQQLADHVTHSVNWQKIGKELNNKKGSGSNFI